MKIEEAIAMLQEEQARGVKSVIVSHWTGADFGFLEDDENWPGIAEQVMDEDWSYINGELEEMVVEAQEGDEECQ